MDRVEEKALLGTLGRGTSSGADCCVSAGVERERNSESGGEEGAVGMRDVTRPPAARPVTGAGKSFT